MDRRASVLALSLVAWGASLGVGVACSDFESAPDDGDASDAAEANAGDSGESGDASSDARPSPCVGAEHFLCADFNAEPYTKNWTDVVGTDGGTLTLDPSASVSPPSSLRGFVEELDASAGTGAMLMKRISVTPLELRLAFAMRVDRTTNAAANVAAIELGDVVGGDGAYFLVTGTDIEAQLTVQVVNHVDGGLVRDDRIVPFGVTTREWHMVTIVLSLPDAGAEGTLAVTVDGRVALDGAVTVRAPTTGARASIGLSHYSNRFPAHEVHIDDVVMDVAQ